MNEVIINGSEISERDKLHDIFSESLKLPEWYGRNLDALYDCLCDISEDTLIKITDFETLERNLDKYAQQFKKVIYNSQQNNEKIHVEFS